MNETERKDLANRLTDPDMIRLAKAGYYDGDLTRGVEFTPNRLESDLAKMNKPEIRFTTYSAEGRTYR